MSLQRGFFLTIDGLKKLEAAINESQFSQEQLGLEAGLDRGTVSKALLRERSVNFRTIRRLFFSLGIPLDPGDYSRVSPPSTNKLPMGADKGDRKRLERAAENAEKLAKQAKTKEERDAYLAEAQDYRDRLESLP